MLRYIHKNPVKAGLVTHANEYKWSSFHEYVNQSSLVSVNFFFEMISNDRKKAVLFFIEYTNEENGQSCLDIDNDIKMRITDEVARDIVKRECRLMDAKGIQKLDCVTRNGYLRMLKNKYSLSIRQIERITGINRGIVFKA